MNQFGSVKPGNPEVCAHCEALLMDVLDRTASVDDQAYFDRHIASCTSCSRMFVDAKRGGAWLEMLRDPRPEPAPALLEKILAQTSGLQANPVAIAAAEGKESPGQGVLLSFPASVVSMPAVVAPVAYGRPGAAGFPGAQILPFRLRAAVQIFAHKMLQPRLAMTAAMAFFSIALTLNLTGVHVTELHASDLRPANLRKGFFEANANVVRYYENLRVVYELEARVHDLQRTADPEPEPEGKVRPPAADSGNKQEDSNRNGGEGEKPPDQKPRPKAGPGTSFKEPLTHDNRYVATLADPTDYLRFADWQAALVLRPAMYTKGDLA